MMVALIALLVFLVNIPFGCWRKSQRKFSMNWFLAIHVPVGISIGLRALADIEFHWLYLLLFVTVFFTGQLLGKLLHDRLPMCRARQKVEA